MSSNQSPGSKNTQTIISSSNNSAVTLDDELKKWVELFKQSALPNITNTDFLDFAVFIKKMYEKEKKLCEENSKMKDLSKLKIIRGIYVQAITLVARIKDDTPQRKLRYSTDFFDIFLKMSEDIQLLSE